MFLRSHYAFLKDEKNAKKDSQQALSDMSLKFFILNKVYQQERLWPYIKSRRNKRFWFRLYSNPLAADKYFNCILQIQHYAMYKIILTSYEK